MDPETKKLLLENLQIAKENNDMLRKLVNAQRWAQIYRVVYWGIIIFSSIGAWYFVQPYLGSLLNVYSGGVSNVNGVGDVIHNLSNNQSQVQDLLNSIKN